MRGGELARCYCCGCCCSCCLTSWRLSGWTCRDGLALPLEVQVLGGLPEGEALHHLTRCRGGGWGEGWRRLLLLALGLAAAGLESGGP